MGPSKYCFVNGCTINNVVIRRDKLPIHFHCLPSNKERSKIWIELCRPSEKKLFNIAYICSLHFPPGCCERDSRNNGIVSTCRKKLTPSLKLPTTESCRLGISKKLGLTKSFPVLSKKTVKQRDFLMIIPCDYLGNITSVVQPNAKLENSPKFALTAECVVESVVTGEIDEELIPNVSQLSDNGNGGNIQIPLKYLGCLPSENYYSNEFAKFVEKQRVSHVREIERAMLREKRMKERLKNIAKELKAHKRSKRGREISIRKLKHRLSMPGFRGNFSSIPEDQAKEKDRKWTDADMLKAQCLKAISRQGYIFVKDVMGFPLPGYSTLMREKKDIFPGERGASYSSDKVSRKRKKMEDKKNPNDVEIQEFDDGLAIDDINNTSLESVGFLRAPSKKKSSHSVSLPSTMEELQSKIAEFKSKIVPSKYSPFTPSSKKRYTKKAVLMRRREQRIKDGTFGTISKRSSRVVKVENKEVPINDTNEYVTYETIEDRVQQPNMESDSLIVLNSDLSGYEYIEMYGDKEIEIGEYDASEEHQELSQFVNSSNNTPYIVSTTEIQQGMKDFQQYIIEEIGHTETI